MLRTIQRLLPVVVLTPVVLLAGCLNNGQTQEKIPSNTVALSKLTYDQYRKLYKDMSTELNLSGVHKVEDFTQLGYVVIVEPELTFGKRNVLTRTGEQTVETTQSKITYEGEDVAVYIDLIYLEQSLSNDMVFIETDTEHFKELNFDERFQETILSYKNTLIRVGVYSTSEKPIPDGMLNDFGKSIVSYLKKKSK